MRTIGFLALAILMFPAFAHAAISITEIMYDVSGTDTGREWLEITNTGNSSIDVSGYKFFEANVNHSLTLISGNGTLQSGSSAVIADNTTKFKIDWPSYSGILFDSSFSLSNTGEQLEIKDGALVVLDSVSYNPSIGAGGDGNSLQLVNGNWISAAPTPGAANVGAVVTPVDDTASSTPETSPSTGGSTTSTYVPPPSTLIVNAGPDVAALLEVPMRFSAQVKTKSGTAYPSARVVWSFGDGSSMEGTAVEKTYRYVGTYVVTATATDGLVTNSDDLVVRVVPAQVHIIVIAGQGITIANDSNKRLDLSDWRLSVDFSSFRIPPGTTILPESSVLFPYEITRLPMMRDASLWYPNGIIAARFLPAPASLPAGQAGEMQPTATTYPAVAAPVVSNAILQPSQGAMSYKKVSEVEPIPSARTEAPIHEKAVSAPAVAIELAAAGAALSSAPLQPVASATSGIFKSPWTLGFLGMMVLAGVAFIFL